MDSGSSPRNFSCCDGKVLCVSDMLISRQSSQAMRGGVFHGAQITHVDGVRVQTASYHEVTKIVEDGAVEDGAVTVTFLNPRQYFFAVCLLTGEYCKS